MVSLAGNDDIISGAYMTSFYHMILQVFFSASRGSDGVNKDIF